MAEPFLAELRIVSFNFPPRGWAFANGQILPINQNQALFSLVGTVYGGDGQTTFALPNLQGRVPLHMGGGLALGARSGEAAHTLTMSEMPVHTHVVTATSSPGTLVQPQEGAQLAQTTSLNYGTVLAAQMEPSALSSVGGGQPHENRQPYLALSFCVALQGIFPSRN